MKNIPQVKIGNEVYDIKDTTAREHLVEVSGTKPTSVDNRLWIKDEQNTYTVPTYDEFESVASRIPSAPTSAGTYVLKASVSGGRATYGWERISG